MDTNFCRNFEYDAMFDPAFKEAMPGLLAALVYHKKPLGVYQFHFIFDPRLRGDRFKNAGATLRLDWEIEVAVVEQADNIIDVLLQANRVIDKEFESAALA